MSRAEPCALLLFGATGDLARRKLAPALFGLHRRGFLHAATPVVGIARQPMSREAFVESLALRETLREAAPEALAAFASILHYVPFDFTGGGVAGVREGVEAIARAAGAGPNRAVYFALPSNLFGPSARLLCEGGLFHGGWRRLCFEKPFGTDLASAEALNAGIARHFEEREIFRIDHYLGKELVRNLMVLRFANPLFEPAWHRDFVDHVQVTIAETLGVEGRAGYYEGAGAVRDMLQNHVMQVLALIAMEPPQSLKGEAVRDAMARAIEALAPLEEAGVVLGQYGEGEVGGARVPAYRAEPGVARDSRVDTFAAVRARIRTPRWEGVPFLLRTGKRLARSYAQADIVLRDAACGLFGRESPAPNVITVRIQPDEGISVDINVKAPGERVRLDRALLDYCHPCAYGPNTPAAYEILLHELLEGDATLFARWDFVRASWAFVDPVARWRDAQARAFPNYAAGSAGPAAAGALLPEGHGWIAPRPVVR